MNAYPRDPKLKQLIGEVSALYPDTERRAKARTVRSIRSQLDHCLMLQSLGQYVEPGLADRLSDQLYAAARTEPFLSLAEVM